MITHGSDSQALLLKSSHLITAFKNLDLPKFLKAVL